MSMNIYTRRGSKVLVTGATKDQGKQEDRLLVKSSLVLNKLYIIEDIKRMESRTEVKLKNITHWFNSVNFENA